MEQREKRWKHNEKGDSKPCGRTLRFIKRKSDEDLIKTYLRIVKFGSTSERRTDKAGCPLQISQPPPIVRRRLKKRRGAFSQTMRPCGQPGVISLMELSAHGKCLKFKLPLVRDADRNLPTQLLFSDEGRAFYSN
ncbi:hypothetical protein TNCT_190721 [Trichonephila clavata]|uniref:Uncharacterized protein n=1 Tax=Trichonephila clavata TaxID=2740835 RepID=A0A8X6IWQ0_TRICU|nr:hypothetical protein TNCT_190721 [Trichonephila clavata]